MAAFIETMLLRTALKTLLTLVLALPIVQCVLVWVRGLLSSMGDQEGAGIINHIVIVCLAAWGVCLAAMVIVMAFAMLQDRRTKE